MTRSLRRPTVRSITLAVLVTTSVALAGCSASPEPTAPHTTPAASRTPQAITAAEFSERLAAYERKHNLRVRVDAIDTGNDHHLGFRATEPVSLNVRGFTAAVLVLADASDDQLSAPSEGTAEQEAGRTLLDTVSAALQTSAPEAQQTLVAWLGGDGAFRRRADALLDLPSARPSARSLATLLDDAVYGEALAPERRSTLRNILLNSTGSTAAAAGTDAPWEVAGVSDTSQTGSLMEVSTLEVPYRASGDAAPVVLATVVTGAADPEAANRAAQEVSRLVTHALPPTR
ncbi:hypothetical protein DEJ30_08255 [Curtobacterium sp. MCPF17_003]|uniref:hypothetical protein n=1 Tax=Curtobacterium sp. MCPF17_003 TaxID=2175637 RepID=UPI000D8F7235|nr:hypothetical protein [Curtobacterium sp. MCPF17_003]PYY64446.1 hypothetical protein DEJ30_08255 [Curtobacterium sp. MCPF17_003]